MARRIFYGGSVHDDDERDAVLAVLDDPNGLRIGKHVAEMEAQVAALFGKRYGVMCNSGSSALYLAVELLDLPPGSEVLTSPLTFSTDIAPLVRAGLVPVFVDVEVDTFQIDVTRMEEMVSRRARRAILVPNLAGNAPDWDAIRAIADRHGLAVIEDSCDALGATLRGTPTGTRADISVTSFSLSHIITCAGDGGMVRRRRPRLARPGAAAAPLGTALRSPALRQPQGRARLLGGPRRHPLRLAVHLRRARMELRTVRAGRRLRPPAAEEAARQPRPPPSELRRLHRVLPTPPGVVRPPAPDRRTGHGVAVVPRDDRSRPPGSPGRSCSSSSSSAASTPARRGPATPPANR